jgi:hypothetical protein
MSSFQGTKRVLFAALGTFVCSAICINAVAQSIDPNALKPFPPADVFSGTAHERGKAYGKLYKDRIRDLLNKEIYEAFIDNPFSKDELTQYAAECGVFTREKCPLIAAECEGIATGAGVTYEEIMLLNLDEELRLMVKKKKKPGHCTAVATSSSDSGDGHTYNGQTWDFSVRWAGKATMTEWQRKDGPSVLAYGYPGLPMGAGVNSEGIAVTWTSGGAKQTRHIGVPSYLLMGHFLAQPDINSIIREANRNMQAGIFTFVISDAKGKLANVEGTPEETAIEQPEGRLARAYFGTRKLTRSEPGKPVKLNPRCQAMYDLLRETSGKNDREMLQRYFTEREFPILQWKSPAAKTLDIMVFDSTDRKAYVTRGPDFHLEWREFAFTK